MIEQAEIVKAYHKMLGGTEFDRETVRRVSQFCDEFKQKRDYDKFTVFANNCDQMIVGQHLRLFSFCEHHLLPFFGEVTIGYIPSGKIMGLSKFQRLVDKVASGPQVQERITEQILEHIQKLLKPKGAGVVVKAIHSCVFARGTQSSKAEFTTSSVSGVFKTNAQARAEFLSFMNNERKQF